jgi:ribosomal protein L10
MESYLITLQENSLSTNQVKKEPVKEVSNLLPKSPSVSWNDLRGLTWTPFEEEL